MKSRELQTIWREWLTVGEKLRLTLHEQTVAVTLRDVARVERLQPELEGLMARVRDLDGRAVACAKGLAGELGVEPNLRSLVRVLEKAEAQQVQLLANKVTSAAQDIQAVIAKNKRLIESEMTYINGTLTLIAKAAVQPKTPYGKRSASTAVLVDQAA
jgi:hypothetical protein